MQERNVLHRDLKLANIMLTKDKKVKIIDFGLAVQLVDFVEEPNTICGTPNYIAPETLNGLRFGPQSDLWALGCILHALLVGKPPFEKESVKDTIAKIRSGAFDMPNWISKEA